MMFTAQAVQGQTSVTQWAIWEQPLTTSQTHAWYDFPVSATFTHSSGVTLRIDGYYNGVNGNGQQVWGIRFAPTLPGQWSWSTASSDPSLRASGVLQAVAPTASQIAANPNLRGHVRVQTSGPRAGRYFVYADGTPFFWLGDTAWEINTLRAGIGGGEYPNQAFYTWLNDRKTKGFTVAQIQFFYLNNRNEGGYLFPDNTIAPGNGSFSRLNAEHARHLDTRLSALHENGLVVATHPTWLSDYKLSVTDAKRISRYMLARYSAYNLVWSLSGEYQYKYPGSNDYDDGASGGVWSLCWNYSSNSPNAGCEWNQLGEAIQSYNAYRHPVSVHPSGRAGWNDPVEWGERAHRQSSSGEFHTQNWLDHNWLQTGHWGENLPYVYSRTANDYALTPTKPVIHSEGFYENIRTEGASPEQVRWQIWTALLNGSAGHTYGASGLWQFYDPAAPSGQQGGRPYDGTTWREALAAPGSNQVKYARDFFSSRAWWTLEPRRDWLRVNGNPPPTPTGSDLSAPHAAAATGSLYVVYLPVGNSGRTIKLTNLGSASYRAQAFNPRTGVTTNLNGGNAVVPTNGEWTIPAGVYSDNNDWVISLSASSGAPPTATTQPTATAVTVTPEPPGGGPFNVKINFQLAGAETPGGYLPDSGAVFGNRGNGYSYGWNADNSDGARDRNSARAPDQRYDTLLHMQREGTFTWEIAVPNGAYTVRVVAGDPDYYDTYYSLNVEGVTVIDGVSNTNTRWLEGTAEVTVQDGRLTLSNPLHYSFNKVAFLEIASGANVATATPVASPTRLLTATPSRTATATSTALPTQTRTALPTSTAMPIPTSTAASTQITPPSVTPSAPPAPSATSTLPNPFFAEYEAEAPINTLHGEARVLWHQEASGENVVGYIGNGPENWLQFNAVTVPQAGAYTLTVRYRSSYMRSATFSINGAEGPTLDFEGLGNWDAYATKDFVAFLSAGENTVRVYNQWDWAPDMDLLAVRGADAPPAPTETATPPTPTETPAPTATTLPSAFQVRLNFQPARAEVPAGYLVDSGRMFGDRGNGYSYGWNARNATTRDRNAAEAPDQRYDTLIHLQRPDVCNGACTWEIALPNGLYAVRLVAGDARYTDSLYRLTVEGVLAIDGTPSDNQRWFEGTVTVTVTDGRLTVSGAEGAVNNKLNFIEITSP